MYSCLTLMQCMYIMPESIDKMSWSDGAQFCERFTPKGDCPECIGTMITVHDEALSREITNHVKEYYPGR